jgi:hypothetical protein
MSAPISPAGDDNVDTDELPALNRLEEALGDIDGVAQVLLSLVGKHDSLNAEATCYLGERLQEHYRMAHDAFCDIAGFDKKQTAAGPQENESVG